ncbi:hypothetical protein RHGRI_006791 [Rhododendron griersonianum]|uniref:Glycoside hydrolase family 3 N-terminal domain-containing protein n=1 Tax=Rhododendron griersonianum TaxID=479676 RepID=A0AAV6KUJ9_9ERIC|nr:hypothetical protein RHGRI_006791 [Rhododendron griersonianum]KAG5556298.1 hypothetical protein RHGRI_006791 [Rhododendron griersonianum]
MRSINSRAFTLIHKPSLQAGTSLLPPLSLSRTTKSTKGFSFFSWAHHYLKVDLGRGEMARISVRFWGILVICLCWAAMAEAEYKKYKDPKQPINVRIKDLMSRMTLEEKIGQMTQIDRTVASGQVINKYLLGSVLSGGGSVPAANASAETWIDMVNGYQVGALTTRLGIPIIYGIDALHGHNNVYNATIFPHNIGLGATRQVYT